MKITDPKLLHELYEIEAERKLLIGYRFKGGVSSASKVNGHHATAKGRAPKAKKRSVARR